MKITALLFGTFGMMLWATGELFDKGIEEKRAKLRMGGMMDTSSTRIVFLIHGLSFCVFLQLFSAPTRRLLPPLLNNGWALR